MHILFYFKAKMKSDIHTLYEGILYGFCLCHGYNKKMGKTGGFYHMVCRHGVRKLLLLKIVFNQCISYPVYYNNHQQQLHSKTGHVSKTFTEKCHGIYL